VVREALHLWNRRAKLRPQGYGRRVTGLERRLGRVWAQRVQGAEAGRLWERYCLPGEHV
jgi:hypothetical protein